MEMESDFATILVEPHALCREGLASILATTRFQPIERLASLEQLDALRLREGVQLLLLADLGPNPDGAAASVRKVKARFHNCCLLVLADQHEARHVWAVLRAGADGYILKSMSPEALIKSLDLAALGEPVFPAALLGKFVSEGTERPPIPGARPSVSRPLSGRETGILRHLARGESNKVIARQLDITEATVKVHIKAILRKIQVRNRTQAAVWALDQGLTAEPKVPPANDPGGPGSHSPAPNSLAKPNGPDTLEWSA